MINAALEQAAQDGEDEEDEEEFEDQEGDSENPEESAGLEETLGESDAEMAASLDEITGGVSPLDDEFDDDELSKALESSQNDLPSDLEGISLGDSPTDTATDTSADSPTETAETPAASELSADDLLDQYAKTLNQDPEIPEPEKQYYESGKTTSEELESVPSQGMSKSLKIKLYALAASVIILCIGFVGLLIPPAEEEVAEVYQPGETLFPEVEGPAPVKPQVTPTSTSTEPQVVASAPASQGSKANYSWTLKGQNLALRAAPDLRLELDLELKSQSPRIASIAPQYSENMESILRNIFYFTPRNKLALPEIRTRILRELQFLIPDGQIEAVQIHEFELKIDPSQ